MYLFAHLPILCVASRNNVEAPVLRLVFAAVASSLAVQPISFQIRLAPLLARSVLVSVGVSPEPVLKINHEHESYCTLFLVVMRRDHCISVR